MKKILLIVLSFLLAFGLNIQALAAESAGTIEQAQFAEQAAFYSTPTAFEGVYQGNDGSYALNLEDEYYTKVGRLDVSFASESSVASALNDSRLTQEVKDYIRKQYEQAKSIGNTDMELSVFSQELLPQTRSTTTEYRTYNGIEMRTDRVYVSGAETPWSVVSKGAQTKEICDDITSIALSFLGLAPVTWLSVTAGSISLLTAFINAGYGSYVTGSSSDFLQAYMKYDSTTQWTYAKIGTDWQHCLVTQKAKIIRVQLKQYYYNSNTDQGKSYITTKDIGEIYISPNFNSPWAAAYQNMNSPLEEWGYWKVSSKYFYF